MTPVPEPCRKKWPPSGSVHGWNITFQPLRRFLNEHDREYEQVRAGDSAKKLPRGQLAIRSRRRHNVSESHYRRASCLRKRERTRSRKGVSIRARGGWTGIAQHGLWSTRRVAGQGSGCPGGSTRTLVPDRAREFRKYEGRCRD